MIVTLLHHSPLWLAAHGARTCWDSGDKSDTPKMECEGLPTVYGECGDKDKELIDRVGNKYRHASILEHISYCFYIEGVSRALLQELSRHRVSSPSVKSSRYTLKELKEEEPFNVLDHIRASKYLVFINNGAHLVDVQSIRALESLRMLVAEGISNDHAKYAMPESFKTTIQWTINLRGLINFLELRLNKSALWEIQDLACKIVQALPAEHLYLVKDLVEKATNGNERIRELVKVFD